MKKSILFAFAAILSFSSFAADVFSSYIESDGTQYIDLGYPLSSDMEVELCVTPLAADQDTYGLFGARSGHSDRNFSMLINYAMSVFNLDFNSSGYNAFRLAPGFTAGKRYRLWSSAAQRRLEQPGANVAYNINDTACSDTFTTAYNANVFEVGGTGWPYAKARVHLLRILKGGALIHEYVPAYTNNSWGLLDRVGNGGFKKEATGNPLTGSLPASPQVAFARANWLPQPKYDYPVECLISSGKEYIDTGLLLTNVHVTSARFAYVNDPAVGGGATLGARDAIDINKHTVFSTCATLQTRQLLLDFYETRHTVHTYLESNLVYSVQLGRQGVRVDSPYGVLYNYVSPDPFLPTAWGVSRPAWIFGLNAADSTFPHPAMRLYEMAINRVVLTGSTPVRDYQPCVTNGVACLYDRVTGTFLGNASGEGAFTAGPRISDLWSCNFSKRQITCLFPMSHFSR